MLRRRFLKTMIGGCPLVLATRARGGQEPKASLASPPTTTAVDALALAYTTLAYGREYRVPEALLTAVDIFLRYPTEEIAPRVSGRGAKLLPPGDPVTEWVGLLEEARRMRPEDAALATVVARMAGRLGEKPRGAAKPRTLTLQVPREGATLPASEFLAGRSTVIVAGNAPVRVEVHDAEGRLLASGSSATTGPATASFNLPDRGFVTVGVKPCSSGDQGSAKVRVILP